MAEENKIATDRDRLLDASARGKTATLGAYIRLSGPGWLQSALTLGGGSLTSSLYLGILAGTSMLWLQPYAMILGIVMLGAISYVTLSTDERPLQAINRHINPILGWSWVAATLLANMVWALPQYSLCFAVIEQNFFPGLFQEGGTLSAENVGADGGKWVVSLIILVLCTMVTWSYGSGHWGIKVYEMTLKLVVAVIVACFIGVVVRMSFADQGFDWGTVFSGFIPNMQHFYEPAPTFRPLLERITDAAAREYWSDLIVSEQRDVMISAGATAVGINMTFLLPYSLLSRGWDKSFRGLTLFDLSTGTFIPFVIATGCVVIAAAAQFHTKPPAGTVVTAESVQPPEHLQSAFDNILASRNAAVEQGEYEIEEPPSVAEQQLAAVLIRRDTFDLANSLSQLFRGDEGSGGHIFANVVFGLGVVGMTLSTISLLMLISGLVFCEIFHQPPTGWVFRLGCLAAASGALWPIIWTVEARAWLAIVTSVFGAMLLPIAYVTFFIMLNQRSLLGSEMPTGWKRVVWNILMAIAALSATAACLSAVIKKTGNTGLGVVAVYLAVVLVVQFLRRGSSTSPTAKP